ncbi:MAG: hypothetical protein ACRDRL_33710 [Sciscionella sp.]
MIQTEPGWYLVVDREDGTILYWRLAGAVVKGKRRFVAIPQSPHALLAGTILGHVFEPAWFDDCRRAFYTPDGSMTEPLPIDPADLKEVTRGS